MSWWCGRGWWKTSPFLVVETWFETPSFLHEFPYEEMIESLSIPDATFGRFGGKARAWLNSSYFTDGFNEVVNLTLSKSFLVGLILSCICRFVQRPVFTCWEIHHLTLTDLLATFETEAQCKHVYFYAYASLLSRQERTSVNGDLTCPDCKCIASNVILHRPIRLDDGSPYQRRNVPQVVLGRSEGHECSICHENSNLRDKDLGTLKTPLPCAHVFCFNCLESHKNTRLARNLHINCPNCRDVGTDIIRHVTAHYWSWIDTTGTNSLLRLGYGHDIIYWHW